MKIARIETLVCNARMRNWIFVKVVTDQPGLHGWGEATLEWHTRGVTGAIEDLSQLLIGEDPTRVEHLWQMMYRQHFWHGNGIVRGTAISGIDLALWDIVGKVHGVPECSARWVHKSEKQEIDPLRDGPIERGARIRKEVGPEVPLPSKRQEVEVIPEISEPEARNVERDHDEDWEQESPAGGDSWCRVATVAPLPPPRAVPRHAAEYSRAHWARPPGTFLLSDN